MKYKLRNENTNQDIIKLICDNRGVEFEKLVDFLNPKENAIMNPLVYANMEKVCNIILDAVNTNKTIGIVIDADADGYCSSAILINYLWNTFGFGNFVFFMHSEKNHGLTPEIMEKIDKNPVDLVILPDASSSDYNQHKTLDDKGIKVVVIDHHEAEKESEYATVVNNQLNFFGNKTLSGGGMVIKVVEMIDKLTGNDNAKNYYDLASVALVGDSMLMNHPETRYYVQEGLKNINNPLLMELYKGDETRNFESISFDVAPTINAFIRIGTDIERQDLFRALIGHVDSREISIRGQGTFELSLPEYIARLASRIKSRQTTAIKKALESENTVIHIDGLPIAICILDEATPKSLTGLIGNRLVALYNKPAIVLKPAGVNYSGSGRSTDTFEDFRKYIVNSNRFTFAQGHAGAFGCSIKWDNLVAFMKEIKGTTLGEEADVMLVDKAYENIVSAYEIMAVDELNNHWARGFDKPKFYIKLTGLSGGEVDIIGQKRDTIRIKHNHITYIKFKCSPEEIEEVKNKNIHEVEIIGSFAVNEYMDRMYPQVLIDKLEVRGTDVEVQPSIGFGFVTTNW